MKQSSPARERYLDWIVCELRELAELAERADLELVGPDVAHRLRRVADVVRAAEGRHEPTSEASTPAPAAIAAPPKSKGIR